MLAKLHIITIIHPIYLKRRNNGRKNYQEVLSYLFDKSNRNSEHFVQGSRTKVQQSHLVVTTKSLLLQREN